MGQTISNIFKKQARIIMVGLDNAGKTTILYKLKLDQTVTTIPTVGFNIEKVQLKKIEFTIWDLGGQERVRSLWKHYLANTDAVVFVVDSSDTDRIDEAAKELHTLLQEEQLKDSILLVMANKQDIKGCLSAQQIKTRLALGKLKDRTWAIKKCIAITGEGVLEAMDWLSDQIEATI